LDASRWKGHCYVDNMLVMREGDDLGRPAKLGQNLKEGQDPLLIAGHKQVVSDKRQWLIVLADTVLSRNRASIAASRKCLLLSHPPGGALAVSFRSMLMNLCVCLSVA
jgi:hypothetical protein